MADYQRIEADFPGLLSLLFEGTGTGWEGNIGGVTHPQRGDCAEGSERYEAEIAYRESCRKRNGVVIPNPYDPCNFGGECIYGAELENYCSSGNNKLQRGCVEYAIDNGINWDDMKPGTNPSGACPEGFARNAEGECENREEFRTRCQEGGGLVIAPPDTGGAGKGGGGRGGASVNVGTHLGTCLTNEEAYTWCNQQAEGNDPSVPAHPRCAEVISIYESNNGGGDDGGGDDGGNNGTGLDSDFDINCNLINRQDGNESGTCGECRPGYKPDNTKLSPFEGITPCVKIEDRIDENPDCVGIHRETEEDGRCGNCKPGYESDGDNCVKIDNTITLGTGNGNGTGSGTDDGGSPSLSCSEQFRKVAQVIEWGGSDSPATEICGNCIDGYTEDASGNCVQDNNNTNNVDDPDDDPCAEVDCTDEANATNECCTGGKSTPFDCASVGKLPLWAGSQPTSEEGCGPCLPTHTQNPDGSCSPKVNGGGNGTDPGLGTGAGAGTGSITQGMFKKYIPEFQPINSELLGRAPSYSSGMNMEGLFKGFV